MRALQNWWWNARAEYPCLLVGVGLIGFDDSGERRRHARKQVAVQAVHSCRHPKQFTVILFVSSAVPRDRPSLCGGLGP
jgi:hypothetical protein